MVIKEEESDKRLNNPLNLINRMRNGGLVPMNKKSASESMSIFIPGAGVKDMNTPATSIERIPSSIPIVSAETENEEFNSDQILNDADGKIKLALAHDDALDLLSASITSLKSKVNGDGVKASSLPSIISAASKVVSEIRRERLEREKDNKDQNVHIHFYCPEQRKTADYAIIDV